MFKVGDVVEGISDHYWVTKKGWVGVVKKVYRNGTMEVSNDETGAFAVNSRDFKLHIPKPITITESYV